ncbi:bromodomain-containing protein DDB_G0270170 [Ananas comosus]|uniref:Bromodomain-containing protein DDB_G0270170 n=1 Tax=Ananas comosus TaxID=4615 RepID=A0A6P5FQA8_ANACO|nr:bromodomain-containing protein DDB_G0270170 [Ananas comosus]
MMAAAARRRGRPPQQRSAAPPPESRRNLRPRRRRLLLNDHYGFSSSSEEEGEKEKEEVEEERGRGEQGRRRRKLKLVLKLPHFSPAKREAASPPPPPAPPSPAPPRSSRPRRAAERRVSESSSSSPPSASSSSYVEDEDDDEEEEGKCEEEEEEEEEEIKPLKKRRIDRCHDRIGSERSRHREIEKKSNVVRRSNGSISGSGNPLPERKTLEAILDKLQKKDTYGVFAEPVDPEELPDYHDVIDHPMDFGTIRKKLARNLYRSFEQFEDDVFLICNNAMQYNAPDTIYFRQARSIQDMARNKFQELRDDNLCTGKKLRDNGLCTGKKLRDDGLCTGKKLRDDGLCIEKKLRDDDLSTKNEWKDQARVKVESLEKQQQVEKGFCRNQQEPHVSDISSAATLASVGEAYTGLSTAQANDVEPSMVVDKSVDNSSSLGESKSEKFDELPARSSPSKPVRLPLVVDENRRATYYTSDEQPKIERDSIFDVLAGEPRQLVAVELHLEYSYARSLARFAATLGPIAWKIASERIEKVLPSGVKFGPGWVGEYEPLPTAIISLENHSQVAKKTKESENRPKAVAISGLSRNINGPKSRAISKTTNRVSNSKEERNNDGNTAKPKQRLFSVIAEPQTRSNGIMLQPKKEQECFTSSLSSPVDTVLRRPEHPEGAASRVSDTVPFLKANGQPKLYINQPDGVSPHTRSSHIGINLGGSSGGKFSRKSDTNQPSNDLGFISKHPQRMAVGNFLSHSSQQHHDKGPAKLVGFSGPKFSQPGNSKSFINTSEKLNSSLRSTVRENHQWMSAVSPSGIRPSADSLSFLNSQVRPTFYSNPAARNVVQFMKQPVQGVSEEPHVHNRGLVIFPQLIPTEIPRSNGCSQEKKNKDTLPPDLNISFPIQGSPVRQSSGIHLDAQQPDLALQL